VNSLAFTPDAPHKCELIASQILRGSRRLLGALGYSSVCELVLPNGRRADIVGLSNSGRILIVEIKSSAADFRSDQKWRDYLDYCDQMYFAVASDGPADLIPHDTGLIVADSYAGHIIRQAPQTLMSSARRRSVLLAFARHAADRLHLAQDPQKADKSC
jgi:hypothetical protein